MVRNEIVFVTSAQPSANPRLLKAAKSLHHAGFLVSVIWCPISPWADEFDKQLFKELPTIKWIKAGFHSQYQPFGYWYARVRQKYWQLIYKLIGNYFDAGIKSLVLYSQELKSIAFQNKAHLYIGHNLGALPAIVKVATKNKAKSIFDFEDFHRGESADGSLQTRIVKEIENRYIPLVDSLTTASSAITEAYQSIFSNKKITTINNCFPLSYAVYFLQKLPNRPLKLFWFSQHIGKNRGLELVLNAISQFRPGLFQIFLLGNCSKENYQYFREIMKEFKIDANDVIFLKPVKESIISNFASRCHLALATEPGRDVNNELALSNKILMYLLAGNAIVASDTYSQNLFLQTFPDVGLLFKKNDLKSLVHVLKFYLDNPNILLQHRKNSLIVGKQKMNWEIEQHILLDNVKKTLSL